MEDQDKHSLNILQPKIHPEVWIQLNSPRLAEGFSDFKQKRETYREFKILEHTIRNNDYKGWTCYTKLDNVHMMRILTKVGAKPYKIDLKHNSIWFAKVVT